MRSLTALGVCPQFCTCSAVRPTGGSPSFCPENEQIELACGAVFGAAPIGVSLPFPVTSPANAGPAPTAATTAAQAAAASKDFVLAIVSLPSRDAASNRDAASSAARSQTYDGKGAWSITHSRDAYRGRTEEAIAWDEIVDAAPGVANEANVTLEIRRLQARALVFAAFLRRQLGRDHVELLDVRRPGEQLVRLGHQRLRHTSR